MWHRRNLTVMASMLLVSCGGYASTSDSPVDSNDPSNDPSTNNRGGSQAAGGSDGSGGGSGSSSPNGDKSDSGSASAGNNSSKGSGDGLPCDLRSVLQAQCQNCHAQKTTGGAPMPLMRATDLRAPAPSDSSKDVAAVALARMQDPQKPMPPSGQRPSAQQVDSLKNWISRGEKDETCNTGNLDGGAGPGTQDAASSEFDTPVTCSSNTTWTGGTRGSAQMKPGNACISCHSMNSEAPRFAIAGTVYRSAHEPNDCNGAGLSEAAQVVITDANGHTMTANVNQAGNFYLQGTIATPYHAKVVANGRTRAMSAAQTSGDCNSCHTERGTNGAPGRIVLP